MLPIVNAMLLLANNEWFLRNVMLRMAGYITDKPTTLQIGRFTLPLLQLLLQQQQRLQLPRKRFYQ